MFFLKFLQVFWTLLQVFCLTQKCAKVGFHVTQQIHFFEIADWEGDGIGEMSGETGYLVGVVATEWIKLQTGHFHMQLFSFAQTKANIG